jgi:maleylacetoacetate isomerase
MPAEKLLLYSYFRSSCSARVRTAANIKGIPLEYSYIHLLKDEQSSPSYLMHNPSGTVPTLIVNTEDGTEIAITQSVAILEFLEEHFPNTPRLLPSDAMGRARVRELVNIICSDVQPVTNLKTLARVKALGGDSAVWAKDLMTRGLEAYEKLAEKYAGLNSVGDNLTMADVVLAPAVEGALRFGVDLEKLETVRRVYERVKGMEAFVKGDWKHQEDTPEELRVK